jgi:hypothetical protein
LEIRDGIIVSAQGGKKEKRTTMISGMTRVIEMMDGEQTEVDAAAEMAAVQ